MLEFLFRLVVETIKFAFRILMILGGALVPALGSAAHAFARTEEDGSEGMVFTANDADRAFFSGEIDAFERRAYRDRLGD
ncbi:hypothetical protein AVME950_00155 [Acidovorax sp. SUPP950]|uniref:hypothetical protein n=1 Tax=Acidovorax sp. SUPP950 TaxID=511901 RepID=UPI0023C1244B|nr:hypothetical protein [Acidovorax sp. SUPP950]GKS73249.1 hypothetical protein AVME950_00155 [Acidovorax sp. SUPP950]